MQPGIKKAIDEIKRMDTHGKVGFIVLYGSSVKEKYGKLSDIDLAIYYQGSKDERFKFRIKILGRLNNKFDIQIFQDLPLYMQKDIVSTGKPLYYSDYNKIFNRYLKTIKDYEDFEKHLGYYYSKLERT